MLLFINPLSSNISLALLEEGSLIEKHIIPRGDDFSSFPEKVIELI